MPDLTIMGKIIGGGLPAAAYGGSPRADGADRAGRRRLPGGHAVGQSARRGGGLATLEHLDAAAYERLAETTEALADGMREAAARQRGRVQVQSLPGLLTIFFTERPVTNYAGAAACDTARLCALVPGAARPRRLPAAVAVRGLVPVARPRPRARDPHGHGGRRGVRGARAMRRRDGRAARGAAGPGRHARRRARTRAAGPAEPRRRPTRRRRRRSWPRAARAARHASATTSCCWR